MHFAIMLNSQTSHKRLFKISSLDGHLQEVIAYEGIGDNGSKFCSISLRYLQRVTPCFNCFIHLKSQFWEKNLVLWIEKFSSLVLSRNAIMLQDIIIQFGGDGGFQEVPDVVTWLRKFWWFGKLVAEERWVRPAVWLYLSVKPWLWRKKWEF